VYRDTNAEETDDNRGASSRVCVLAPLRLLMLDDDDKAGNLDGRGNSPGGITGRFLSFPLEPVRRAPSLTGEVVKALIVGVSGRE